MPLTPPPIGQPWPTQGGTYAGIARGQAGGPDQHLILSPSSPSERLQWQAATDWAAALRDGNHADWSLPARDESALLYANLRELFASSWHWTGTQYSRYDAWYQYFSGGGQVGNDKSYEGHARAVRRFSVESFNHSDSKGA